MPCLGATLRSGWVSPWGCGTLAEGGISLGAPCDRLGALLGTWQVSPGRVLLGTMARWHPGDRLGGTLGSP